MMFEDISEKQLEVLNFIKSELRAKGYPPAVREIGKAVDLKSTATVYNYLKKLEEKGYIRRDPSKPRAIEVLNQFAIEGESGISDTINVPVVGRVAAGEPILAEENIENIFPMPVEFVSTRDAFMLQVAGDSMINAGIYDGDFIIVNHQNNAENGDIVVAMLSGEATVKRFFKEKDHIRLQPENDQMAPILSKDVIIVGKVTGLFRKM